MSRVWQRLRAVFARGRIDGEIDEELRFHLDVMNPVAALYSE